MSYYTLFSNNNGKLVEVATFPEGSKSKALEALGSQTQLFRLMNPHSTFDPFLAYKGVIVAQGEKGDLDTWVKENKGNFLNGCHLL